MQIDSFTPHGGTLYVVPTPLGNLGDITYRGLSILQQADLILAEDTRVLQKLLEKYQIAKPVVLSYREQVHDKVYPKVKDWLTRKQIVILTSDAGTPGISDPGALLINALQQDGYSVDVLPGANAVTTALVQSGLPTDHFTFLGFLPRKKGKLTRLVRTSLELHEMLPATFIAYESSHRVVESLQTIWEEYESIVTTLRKSQRSPSQERASEAELDPEVKKFLQKLKAEARHSQAKPQETNGLQLRVARELTKQFGESSGVDLTFDLTASKQRFTRWLSDLTIKGEFVVLLRWQFRLQDFAVADQD